MRSIIVAAVLVGVLQSGFSSAHATNASGHCTGMTVTDYISSDAANGTISTAFVNVIDGRLNFTTSSTGCVTITFAAKAIVFPTGTDYEDLHVRTLMDGSQLCAPALADDVFLSAHPLSPGIAASVTHVCKNVAAGVHVLQMQYRSGNGAEVQLIAPVLTVTHN